MGAALGDRSLFPALESRAYLAHAAISPPSVVVTEALHDALRLQAAQGARAFGRFVAQRSRLRPLLAQLLGAGPDDIALVANTTTGVLHVALSLPWQPGDHVLCFEGEFPANVTPWQRAAERFGLVVDFAPLPRGPAGETDLDALARALHPRTRVVALSAVQFQTGWAADLGAVAALCHAQGAELFVDAIQGAGVVPLDVRAQGVDYLVAGSHKWLMGVEGVAALYIAPERRARLRPVVRGWLSHEDGLAFLFHGEGHLRYDRPFRESADVFELGAPNTLGCVALEASVGLLLELGVPRIFEHVSAWLDAAEAGLLARGFRSARGAQGRSGTLSVRPPHGEVNDWLHTLSHAGIHATGPDGWLRLAPHWPNALGEVSLLLEAIDAHVANGT